MKKILFISALVLGGLAYLGWRKVENLKEHFSKLKILPIGVSDFKATLKEIRFKVDVQIYNPEPESFDVSGIIATLKRLNVYWKGQFLATGSLNITSISIPAKDKLILHDIEVIVPLTNVMQVLTVLDTISVNDLQVEAVVEALGENYLIKT